MTLALAQQAIEFPHQPMTSPANQGLPLVLFKANEGLEQPRGVDVYEGILTYGELIEHFQVEANSDVLPEAHKRQRDVDKARINGLKRYWESTPATVFPNMTFFANELSDVTEQRVGNRRIIEATLSANADRFICDGQGRTTFIHWLLAQDDNDAFSQRTISFKLIVTHTDNLTETKAVSIIKQVFADYHCHLKKPNASISGHFNNSTPFSRMINELLRTPLPGDHIIQDYIALHGNCNNGQLWTHAQFSGMIQKLLNTTPAKANKALSNAKNYQTSLNVCQTFLTTLFPALPLDELLAGDDGKAHDDAIFTKAIFAYACGYVGQSLTDELLTSTKHSWSVLADISQLPLASKSDKAWLKANVTTKEEGKIKIATKQGDKRLAGMICRQLNIYPCQAIMA